MWALTTVFLDRVAVAAEVQTVDPGPGGLADRLAPADDADLVLVYGGERDGEIGTCGCGRAGGLPRLATYVAAVRDAGRPALVLDVGSFLASVGAAGQLSDWSRTMNDGYHRALTELRFDAFNVSYRDLPGAVGAGHPGYVSATHRPEQGPIARYKSFQAGALQVAVTGVSRDGLATLQPPMAAVVRPVEAVRGLLPELEAHDVVVVMAYEVPSAEVRAIAQLPGVDVVIEAGGFDARWPASVEGEAVWVRSLTDGVRAGELRLWVDGGRVVRAVDRQVPLDDGLPAHPRLDRLEREQDRLTAPE